MDSCVRTRLQLLSISKNFSRYSKLMRSAVDRDYMVSQTVAVKAYRGNDPKWILGTISYKTGPVSNRVGVGPDVKWRRHADQIQDSHLHMKEGIMSHLNTGVNLPIVDSQQNESYSLLL